MKKASLLELLVLVLSSLGSICFGQAPNLGTASNFTFFTAVGAFNNVGASIITGNIGTNVGALTGFPPGIVTGQTHVADAVSVQAALDVESAYSSLSPVVCGSTISTALGNGQILAPNVYCLGAASTLNGSLTLDGQGNPNALFIFKINGALATGGLSNVMLINGASWSNVYWQINGQVDLGAASSFKGTILANGAINLLLGAILQGRGLSRAGAINLNTNVLNALLPDLTPTILLPQANFTATGINSVRFFIVNVFEVLGQATSSGNVVITITAPLGYTLAYSNLLSVINVSGGIANPVLVDNIKWAVMSNPSDRQYTLKMNSGQDISALGASILGFTITRTTANTGSSSNITVNVSDDPTNSYDSNPLNNVYARIIAGL